MSRNTAAVKPRSNSLRSLASGRALAIVVALVLIAVGCSAETTIAGASGQQAGANASSQVAATGDIGPTSDELNTIALIERFAPSAASLSVVVDGQQMLPDVLEDVDTPDSVLPRVDGPAQRSSGSGFIIDLDGIQFLVSNFHVVEATLQPGTSDMFDNATIAATFPDHPEGVPLEVVGINPSFDLALLQVVDSEIPFPSDAMSIPIADSDLVQKGQKTLAFGNPFGLGASVTSGIVSSTGRFIESIGQVSVPMIQTDAAINPGNSGGALLNSSGELIGINTAIFNPEARAFAGIGFAVPSNLLREALANLELGGVSSISDTRPSFGAQLGTLSLLPPAIREEAGLPEVGVAVLGVAAGGPAEAAGLRVPEFTEVQGVPVPIAPDVIVAIDGEPVRTADDLNLTISYEATIGQEVVLTVLRDGAEVDVAVQLGGG